MEKSKYKLISKKTSQKIFESKKCLWCWKYFSIFELQKNIEKKLKVNIQQNLCYDCFLRKLMMFRNETNIYKNVCAKCWKNIISIFPPESKEIIYCFDCYENDDFSKKEKKEIDIENIEKIFLKLYEKTPKKALVNENSENSKYANYVWMSKNIYLSYLIYSESQNIFYSYYVLNSKDCIDCCSIRDCEKCLECINTIESYNCYYSYNLVNCQNCYFSLGLQNCNNCIFSSNLINKQYYIFNKEYKKEEYEKILKNLKNQMSSSKNLEKLKKDYKKLEKKSIYKNLQTINIKNSIWNFLSNSKNAIFCSHCDSLEDCVNVWWGNIKDSINTIWWWNIQKSYNSCLIGFNSYDIIWCFNVSSSHSILNSIWIHNSNNILFSVWLRNKSYHILNQKYEKEEYEKISKQIINSQKQKNIFWDFLSNKLNKIPYNDSAAWEYFPIWKLIYKDWKEKILDKNALWKVYILEPEKFLSKAILDLWWEEKIEIIWKTFEKEINIPKWINLIEAKDIPDKISDLKDENKILTSAIICEKTKRPFRIMKYELEFYKKNNLCIPKIHPKIRHLERIKKISSKSLYTTQCKKCRKKIITTLHKKNENIIYCWECYNKEVY